MHVCEERYLSLLRESSAVKLISAQHPVSSIWPCSEERAARLADAPACANVPRLSGASSSISVQVLPIPVGPPANSPFINHHLPQNATHQTKYGAGAKRPANSAGPEPSCDCSFSPGVSPRVFGQERAVGLQMRSWR